MPNAEPGRRGIPPAAGVHDFDGTCAPNEDGTWGKYENQGTRWSTFSFGIFEWIRKKGGQGLKRGKVKMRIIGDANNPAPVYRCAREMCQQLDVGGPVGQKTMRIWEWISPSSEED